MDLTPAQVHDTVRRLIEPGAPFEVVERAVGDALSTPTASSISPVASKNSSSAAARTSHPPRSKTLRTAIKVSRKYLEHAFLNNEKDAV